MSAARKLLASLLLLAATGLFAAEAPRYLEVTGNGRVTSPPDTALLVVAVEPLATTVAEAQAVADRSVGSYLKAARKLGAKPADLLASGANIQPEYHWDQESRTQQLVGYRVSREVRVRIRELERLADYLQASVRAGMTRMNPPTLSVRDAAAMNDRALQLAAADARHQAQLLADALSVTLGSAARIEVLEEGGGAPPVMMKAMAESRMADGAAPIETGEIEVLRRLRIRFDLGGE